MAGYGNIRFISLGFIGFLIVLICSNSNAFLVDDDCTGRCGHGKDNSKSCQCNSQCLRYNDCCTDYQATCGGGGTSGACKTMSQTAQSMWDDDVNKMPQSKYSINLQSHVTDGTHTDHATQDLFSGMDTMVFQGATYKAFFALLDNYDHDKGDAEHVTSAELAEEQTFLDAILSTKVMADLKSLLMCKNKITSDSDFRSLLNKLWFEMYPRSGSSTVKDTSGFEHLMAGEYKSSTQVNGFHSWLTFYKYEHDHALNYYGWVRSKSISGHIGVLGAAFNWQGRIKTMGSFFVGVSPEFDIAIYTMCFVLHPGQRCSFTIHGVPLSIQSYSTHGHIATAYVSP